MIHKPRSIELGAVCLTDGDRREITALQNGMATRVENCETLESAVVLICEQAARAIIDRDMNACIAAANVTITASRLAAEANDPMTAISLRGTQNVLAAAMAQLNTERAGVS